MNICKGTTVEIKTTNGGLVVARLLEDYRPTYPTVVSADYAPGYRVIMGDRIASVREVQS